MRPGSGRPIGKGGQEAGAEIRHIHQADKRYQTQTPLQQPLGFPGSQE